MATIEILVKGATRGARVLWDAQPKSLKKTDSGFAATFQADAGTHVYVVSVSGDPGEKWSVKVKGGKKTFNHAGHMSPGGLDTTGDTPYEVKQ